MKREGQGKRRESGGVSLDLSKRSQKNQRATRSRS